MPFFLFCFLLFPQLGFTERKDHQSFSLYPFQMAFSGAGVGALEEEFSYLINPAILGFYNRSQTGVAYHRILGPDSGIYHKTFFSFADKSSFFPVGVTYERTWNKEIDVAIENRWEGSVGTLIHPRFSLGFTLQKEDANINKTRWNAKMGFLLRFRSRTHVGLVFNDLISFIKDSDNKPPFIFGIYNRWFPFLNTRIDLDHKGLENWVLRAGMETLIRKFIALRLGTQWNPSSEKKPSFSTGLGLKGPRLRLNLSYKIPSSFREEKEFALTGSVSF